MTDLFLVEHIWHTNTIYKTELYLLHPNYTEVDKCLNVS